MATRKKKEGKLAFETQAELNAEMAKKERDFVVVNQSWMNLHNGDRNVAWNDACRAEGKDAHRFWDAAAKEWREGVCQQGPHYFIYTE